MDKISWTESETNEEVLTGIGEERDLKHTNMRDKGNGFGTHSDQTHYRTKKVSLQKEILR